MLTSLAEVQELTRRTDRRLTEQELASIVEYAFGDLRPISDENEERLQTTRTVPKSTIEQELGQEILLAYHYLDSQLFERDRNEKTSNSVQKRRHAYDSAFHARMLGFSSQEIALTLLHDIITDTARSVEQGLEEVNKMQELFGDYIAENVNQLTDLSAVLITQIQRAILFELGGPVSSRVSDLKKIYARIKTEHEERYKPLGLNHLGLYSPVKNAIERLNQTEINQLFEKNPDYNIYTELKTTVAKHLIEQIFKHANEEFLSNRFKSEPYQGQLIALGCSYIDRVRTRSGETTLKSFQEATDFTIALTGHRLLLQGHEQRTPLESRINNQITVLESAIRHQIEQQTGMTIDGYRKRSDTIYRLEIRNLEENLERLKQSSQAF